MNAVKWVGLTAFLIGVLGFHISFLLEESTIVFGLKISMVLMGIGAAILILTMSVERYKDWKKMKEEISEEDLRP